MESRRDEEEEETEAEEEKEEETSLYGVGRRSHWPVTGLRH